MDRERDDTGMEKTSESSIVIRLSKRIPEATESPRKSSTFREESTADATEARKSYLEEKRKKYASASN